MDKIETKFVKLQLDSFDKNRLDFIMDLDNFSGHDVLISRATARKNALSKFITDRINCAYKMGLEDGKEERDS